MLDETCPLEKIKICGMKKNDLYVMSRLCETKDDERLPCAETTD